MAALQAFSRNLSGSCVQSWTGSDPCSGSWNGIGCNALGGVVSISLQNYYSSCWGSLNFSVVLKNVTSIAIRNTYVSGSVVLGSGSFPLLVSVDLSQNKFNGTLSLSNLSWPNIQSLDLSNNQFTGPLVLDSLPSSLVSLQLHHNRFSGSAVLDRLPLSLSSLHLEYNELTTISFGASLFALNYSRNQSIHGSLSLLLLLLTYISDACLLCRCCFYVEDVFVGLKMDFFLRCCGLFAFSINACCFLFHTLCSFLCHDFIIARWFVLC